MQNLRLFEFNELSAALKRACSAKLSVVLNEVIEPLYGDQQLSLAKIEKGRDRQTFVAVASLFTGSDKSFLDDDTYEIAGLLVVKNRLANGHDITSPRLGKDFEAIKFSLEVKTLIVAENYRGKGLGKRLMNQLLQVAQAKPDIRNIHFSICEDVTSTQRLFQSFGFQQQGVLSAQYLHGKKELIFSRRFQSTVDTMIAEKGMSSGLGATSVSRQSTRDQITPAPAPLQRRPASAPLRPDEHKRLVALIRQRRQLPKFCAELPLKGPYFNAILDGRKTVEGRISTGGPARLRANDYLLFTSGNGGCDACLTQVTEKRNYTTFREMLADCGVVNCLPGFNGDLSAAVALYRSFPGYAEKESRHGVCAVFTHLLDRDELSALAEANALPPPHAVAGVNWSDGSSRSSSDAHRLSDERKRTYDSTSPAAGVSSRALDRDDFSPDKRQRR